MLDPRIYTNDHEYEIELVEIRVNSWITLL